MNENIDLKDILKDCPIGWKFYSSIYGNVTFSGIENNSEYPVRFLFSNKNKIERYGCVTKEGFHNNSYNGECTFFPSKDQRNWSNFTAPWYKKEKFDPKTLHAFDKVLVRDDCQEKWCCNFFSHINHDISYSYTTIIADYYAFCIPYNDDTKHLVDTKEEAPEYYKYWDN